jgi:hypothetical protein
LIKLHVLTTFAQVNRACLVLGWCFSCPNLCPSSARVPRCAQLCPALVFWSVTALWRRVVGMRGRRAEDAFGSNKQERWRGLGCEGTLSFDRSGRRNFASTPPATRTHPIHPAKGDNGTLPRKGPLGGASHGWPWARPASPDLAPRTIRRQLGCPRQLRLLRAAGVGAGKPCLSAYPRQGQ